MAIKEQEKHKNYRRHRKETEKEQTRVLPVIILSVSGLKHSNKSGGGGGSSWQSRNILGSPLPTDISKSTTT